MGQGPLCGAPDAVAAQVAPSSVVLDTRRRSSDLAKPTDLAMGGLNIVGVGPMGAGGKARAKASGPKPLLPMLPPPASPTPRSSCSEADPGSPTPAGSLPCTPSHGERGLAERRKFPAKAGPGTFKEKLQILTKQDQQPADAVRGEIRAVSRFADSYDLGGEVMPSCHKGMQVLHATHNPSSLPVVIKIRIKKDSFRNRQEEDSWRSSTEFMLGLPAGGHIAQVYEVLEDDKAYYVIMEKVSGQDLFESISGQDLPPMSEVQEIVSQILAGLADLHAGGRIHKDIKLENIMLERTASTPTTARSRSSTSSRAQALSPTSPVSVKLIDFDTVEAWQPETPKRTRDVLGTDQYIAQEAYDGNYSPASDMFAVGVIAYRLCTGKFPFKGDMFDDKPGENWVGSPKMKEIRGRLRSFKIKWMYRAFELEPAACDLLKGMLADSEMERPTAREALQHPWLNRTTAAVRYNFNNPAPLPSDRPARSQTFSGGFPAPLTPQRWNTMPAEAVSPTSAPTDPRLSQRVRR
uniref:Protein kinase domain-containing protein n=1 Tax=Zooxanthella nutricula TaxID=1333877 RepID=A0A7S2VKP8_9DINO|mmetsp:Transcript_82269/g.251391  ORF Transcript_82269/g.251391 Transcript_82269/m.251391 type:complete len:521 (+) Transcript_82269:3-1565(+)